jgi:hypothetical protein
VIQQGRVFKLAAKGADGEPLWAYRYRLEGRSSARPQVGGFASPAEAQSALRKALDRVGPGRGGATTLAELVEEYLELHQAEPVTSRSCAGCSARQPARSERRESRTYRRRMCTRGV